jgi:hypothetical protein
MSETVTYKGKLQKVAEGKEGIEAWCKQFVEYKQRTLEGVYEDYTEMVIDEYYPEIIEANEILFKVLSRDKIDNEDIFQMKDLGNGEYEYLVQYYNGGCSFPEALEHSLNDLKPEG